MSKNKLPTIDSKQIGKNLNVTIEGEEKLRTLTGSKEELAPLRELIKAYKLKPTKKALEEIQKLLSPVSTKVKEEKEKKQEQIKAEIKSKKNIKKTETKSAGKKKSLVNEIRERLESGNTTQKEVNELEALIEKSKQVKAKTATTAIPSRRFRDEY